MVSASKINIDPTIFLSAVGVAIDSGVSNAPPTPEEGDQVTGTQLLGVVPTNDSLRNSLFCCFKMGYPHGESPFKSSFRCLVRSVYKKTVATGRTLCEC